MSALNQYWYFLVGGPIDENMGTVANFYAYGQHCGEALENALQAATEELGIITPEATEAIRLDILEDFEAPDNLIELTDLVSTGLENYSYPLNTEKDFIPPTGIIKSADEGEFDYELVKNNFLALKDERGSFELELVADKAKLLDTFLHILALISTPARVRVCIKGHWHNQKNELWEIEAAQLPVTAEQFLLDNKKNIFENGFVEYSVVIDSTSTKLFLTEHKKIFFQTNDQELFNKLGYRVIDLGFEQTKELYNLEYGFYHWHYRPAQSLDAPDLRLLLLDAGFNFTKSWDEASGT